MLKYSNGFKYDLAPISRQNDLRIHGFTEKGPHDINIGLQGSGSHTPRTFWKSPYSGKNNIPVFRTGSSQNQKQFLKPELPVEVSPLKPRRPFTESNGTVRGILKNKDGGDGSSHVTQTSVEAPSMTQYETLNLITTGNGETRPHGVRQETRSAGKRVQFNNLPNPVPKNRSNFLNLPIGTATSQRGRRLFFNKTAAVRVLGSASHVDKYGGSRRLHDSGSDNRYMATASLNSGESYIKSQINDFVKKLRLAESAKHARKDSSHGQRVNSGSRSRTVEDADQWKEFDLERPIVISDNGDSATGEHYNTDVAESSSVSLESLGSPSETNIAESTPGGAEVYRRRTTMASLFTKYRHITNNNPDLRRYQKRSVLEDTKVGTDDNSKNFCDNDKTSQILGWLEDMKTAQGSSDDGTKSSKRDLSSRDVEDKKYGTKVNTTATRVTVEPKRTELSYSEAAD